MTSPAITKSPENQKNEKKSPSHSTGSPQRVASNTDAAAASTSGSNQQQPETFSWLRIFKLADLMMKQGC